MKAFIADLRAQFSMRSQPARRIGLVLLALVAISGPIALIGFSQESTAPGGWIPYLASNIFFIAACYVLFPYRKAESGPAPVGRIVLAAGLLILGLGTFMRFYRFDSLPFGTWSDEADIGLVAQRILNNPAFRPFFVTSNDHPLHFFSLVALSFKLFGVSTEAVRLVTVIFGLLTVVLAFLAGREAFGNRFGLLFAFVFAVSRWHTTFSRFGVYTITFPFFELLTLWLLLRARRTGQLHDFAWAGLAFGMGVNFYLGIRLFVVALGLFILYWIATTWLFRKSAEQAPDRARLLGGLAVFSVAVGLAVAPHVQFAVTHPDIYWGRASQVSIFSQYPDDRAKVSQVFWQNTVQHATMFNYKGDRNGRHNLPGAAMLDPVMGILFVLGLAIALSRLRHPVQVLMLIIFVVGLLGGILTLDFESPQSNRAFGAIVAVLFFVALAVETLWRRFDQSRLPATTRMVAAVALLAVGGYVVYYNARAFFVDQANNDRVWIEYNGLESSTAYRMLEADPERTSLYASSFLNNHLVIQFLAPQVQDSKTIVPPVGLPIREAGDRPVAIFVDENNTWISDEARQFYPNASVRVDTMPSGRPALYTITVSPDEIQHLQGLNARYWLGEAVRGAPVLTRDEKMLSVQWPGDLPIAPPFIAEWISTLYVPAYGTYELILKAPGEAALWLDEQQRFSGSGEQRIMLTLAEGDHALRVQASGGDGLASLEWRQADSDGQFTAEPLPIQPSSLYLPALVPVKGLIGTYYENDSWSGTPALIRIDPFVDMYIHILPIARPYTVDWRGQINLPTDGDWAFGLRVNGQAQLFIDDQLIVDATEPTDYLEGRTAFDAGWHRIQIRFLDYLGGSRIHLSWTPPGGTQQIVPSNMLRPEP
jgi:4-amino-4-deoxy-L-arabinose transferase-like glycosyltransferase